MVPSDAHQRHRLRLRSWQWIAISFALVVVLALLALASVVPFSSETLRQEVVDSLSDRFDGEVELAALHIRIFPRFHADGFGLTIRHKHRHDVPPLITVKSFSVDADLLGLLRKHVARVRLDGLDIEIPPDHNRDPKDLGKPHDRHDKNRDVRTIVVDNMVSTDARFVTISDKKDKASKVWKIHALHMRSVSFDQPMPFEATLTNGVPPGEIDTAGSFGPWQSDDPGQTPLDGKFTFDRADLGVFKGISGILSAHGTFSGSLGRIDILGETETPEFTVAVSGQPVPLQTKYHAIVDGTSGDTRLERIDASFLRSSLVARGGVVDTPGKDGRTVTLDVTMDDARIEDVLRLAVKTPTPPMTGTLKLTTKLVLPPGTRDVVDKLRLDGRFAIGTARFTNLDVQKKVNELSHRGRGKTPDEKQDGVVSDFKGRFKLADGTLALPGLTFNVLGAGVSLAGSYGLRSETLDFRGTLFMDAKVSQTTTGFKRVLLMAVDPLFKKTGGGSAIPIKITGTRNDPSFGLDKGRVFKRGK